MDGTGRGLNGAYISETGAETGFLDEMYMDGNKPILHNDFISIENNSREILNDNREVIAVYTDSIRGSCEKYEGIYSKVPKGSPREFHEIPPWTFLARDIVTLVSNPPSEEGICMEREDLEIIADSFGELSKFFRSKPLKEYIGKLRNLSNQTESS